MRPRRSPCPSLRLAWATLERAAAVPPAREREHDRKLPLIRAQQEAGAIRANAPPALILMAVMALATAWSPVFPFGATANTDSDRSTDTVREATVGMVASIVGQGGDLR